MAEPKVHELAVRLAEITATAVAELEALLEAVVRGLVAESALPGLVAALVAKHEQVASGELYGDLVAGLVLEAIPTTHVVPLPAPRTSLEAAEAAVHTILDTTPGELPAAAPRLSQLVRGAVAHGAQDTRADVIARSPIWEGWTRGIDSTSCELCVWWWRGGQVWPKSHHMPRHPGCTCVQVPTLSRRAVTISREAARDSDARRRLEARGEYLESFGTGLARRESRSSKKNRD